MQRALPNMALFQARLGSLVFGRDLIIDLHIVADWLYLQQHHQQLIDQGLIHANRQRFAYDFKVGEQVLKLSYQPDNSNLAQLVFFVLKHFTRTVLLPFDSTSTPFDSTSTPLNASLYDASTMPSLMVSFFWVKEFHPACKVLLEGFFLACLFYF